jgi:hypothetical protein
MHISYVFFHPRAVLGSWMGPYQLPNVADFYSRQCFNSVMAAVSFYRHPIKKRGLELGLRFLQVLEPGPWEKTLETQNGTLVVSAAPSRTL